MYIYISFTYHVSICFAMFKGQLEPNKTSFDAFNAKLYGKTWPLPPGSTSSFLAHSHVCLNEKKHMVKLGNHCS